MSTTSINPPAPEPDRRVLFEPFRWNNDTRNVRLEGTAVAEFVSAVRDVSGGVETVLQLFKRDDIDRDSIDDSGQTPPAILSDYHRSQLNNLCITALGLLYDSANRMSDFIDEKAQNGQGGAA